MVAAVQRDRRGAGPGLEILLYQSEAPPLRAGMRSRAVMMAPARAVGQGQRGLPPAPPPPPPPASGIAGRAAADHPAPHLHVGEEVAQHQLDRDLLLRLVPHVVVGDEGQGGGSRPPGPAWPRGWRSSRSRPPPTGGRCAIRPWWRTGGPRCRCVPPRCTLTPACAPAPWRTSPRTGQKGRRSRCGPPPLLVEEGAGAGAGAVEELVRDDHVKGAILPACSRRR